MGLATASLNPLKIIYTEASQKEKRKKKKISNILIKHCILDSFVKHKGTLLTLRAMGL